MVARTTHDREMLAAQMQNKLAIALDIHFRELMLTGLQLWSEDHFWRLQGTDMTNTASVALPPNDAESGSEGGAALSLPGAQSKAECRRGPMTAVVDGVAAAAVVSPVGWALLGVTGAPLCMRKRVRGSTNPKYSVADQHAQ